MTTWTDMPMAAFDLETTGPNPMWTRIVTAHISTIDTNQVSGRNWLLDPEIDIPEGAAKVHGITTEQAREQGQDYAEGYAEIRAKLISCWDEGRIIAAFNASFDFTIIDREGRRLGYDPLPIGAIVDPYVIDRAIDTYRKGKRTLEATCAHYGVEMGEAHTADADALAAARLAWVLGRRSPDLAGVSVDDLMQGQATWHRKRQDDFAAYLRKQGKDATDVNGEWPVRTEKVPA